MKIELEKIIKRSGLDKKEVANQLFPENKFPVMALTRVLNEEALLDADQISKLALMLNVDVDDLYRDGWHLQRVNTGHVFTRGDYVATLDTFSWTMRIHHKGSMFHEEVLCPATISMHDFIQKVNDLIEYKC